jgi:hypothetical protein
MLQDIFFFEDIVISYDYDNILLWLNSDFKTFDKYIKSFNNPILINALSFLFFELGIVKLTWLAELAKAVQLTWDWMR